MFPGLRLPQHPPLLHPRTPAAFEIADANASVSNISFPDEDLDVNEVGGGRLRELDPGVGSK